MELSHSLAYQQYSRIPDHVHVINSKCKGASSHHHHQTNIPINIIKPAPKYLSDFSFKYCSINGLSSFGVHDNPRRRTAFKQRPVNFTKASSQAGAPAAGSDTTTNKLSTFIAVFLRFLRPYSLYETIVASVSMVARSWLIENPNLLNWSLLLNAFIGLFALFCLNVYYVGINQIYDVDIDKVNKPELPLAAGDLSVESAWLLVIAFAVNGLLIVGLKGGPLLTCLYSLGLFVATAYSAPPFRLKRFAFGPMFTIVMMRGILLNIGLHYAARAAIGLTFEWTRIVMIPAHIILASYMIFQARVLEQANYTKVYDVDIDKINKPELPLAAGDLSMESAWLLVIFYAVTGLLIVGYSGGPVLLALSCLGLLVGTIYSVPPFRWKRFAVGTMIVIGTMRGLLHIGLNYATRAVLGLPFQWTYQIATLATKLGVRNVAFLGTGLMLLNYGVGVLAAIYMPQIPIKPTCRFSDFSFKCSNALSSLRLYKPTIGFKHGTEILYKRSSISATDPVGSNPILNEPSKFLVACWSFMRPYSLYGNVVISVSLVTRSWLLDNPNLITPSLLLKASYGLLALIFVTGYISGINQIYDVNIDKINKPYLPIAAGQLSVKVAWSLVIFYAVAGVLIVGWNGGPFLACLYSLALLMGTAYSVPPFRLKRYAFVTMLTSASVRGFLLHFTVSYASSAGFGLTFQWSAPLVFITIKASLFALVMSFVKDFSDIEGDRKYQVSTLAVKFGVRNIAFLGSGILLVKYIVGVLAAMYMPQASYGLLALIFVTGYISGINQIYDVNIDKINKPYLPIAAGQLSVKVAWSLVIFYAVAGVLIVGWNGGPFLACLYSLALLMGTAYSVPPFRLKRYAFVTMLTSASVRGFLLHFTVSYASSAGFGLTFQWSAPLVFITIKASLFALVMSFVKDFSDIEGDRKYQVSTLAVKFGVRNIAFLGSGILLVKYIVGVLAAMYMPQASYGLLALIFVTGYISGINQIYDVNIDKINKPYLPIAAGQLSVKVAWSLVIFYAVAGVLIVGWNGGPFLACLYSLALLMGTAYSVPPFRLKRYAFVTMLTSASVRGFLLHFTVSYASSAGFGLTFQWSAPLVFITIKASLFALVMSFVKDFSDIEGDRKYQVSTLAVKFGVRNIAFLGSGILLVKYIVGVLAAMYMPQAADPAGSDPILNKPSNFLDACWSFMRPFSLYGNVVVSVSLVTRSWLLENPNLITSYLLLKASYGLLALIFVTGYISGINQIYDVNIDKYAYSKIRINKPNLLIAAGQLSIKFAWSLVIFYAVAGVLIVGLNGGLFLACLYSLALFMGTAYSVPPFRLKRFAFGTMLTLALMRGFLLHFTVSYASSTGLGLTFQWTAPLVFITIKASLFALVMSFVKDLSDVEGDRKHQVSTLAIKFGVRNIAFLGSGILLVKYIVGVLATMYMPQEASEKFYGLLWNLMNAEYLIYPFI
ncbi:hypothetical protein JRO89_XS07G0298200 [Xanthoceras sorbifolium]|uniref:Prenyltransferase n=1 Tax=Xanthoceras sorbifolium TaxID=99658 RepID=A0ABQ8HVZ5_9ROSI|nr:hypothetical protein JRO89_XS07G0298200 [Xanthoceras sorbifolium]